jgi:hypothetical protein
LRIVHTAFASLSLNEKPRSELRPPEAPPRRLPRPWRLVFDAEGGVTIALERYVGSITHITRANTASVGIITIEAHSQKCRRLLLMSLRQTSINPELSCFIVRYCLL